MKEEQVHPEGLIDLALDGELRGKNVDELDSHLAGCVSCAFERELQDDFALLLKPVDGTSAEDESSEEPLDASCESIIEKTLRQLAISPKKAHPVQSR